VNSEYLVLVVEDDSSAYEMLRHCLRRAGHFVLVWAENAAEGLAEIPKQAFDIVLLDLTLPDSRGIDTVKGFTETSSVPVVVLSGLDDEELALESVQQGADDYLVKGKFDTPLLSKTIRFAIERFRLTEQLAATTQLVQQERELRRLEADANQAFNAPASGRQDVPLSQSCADHFSHAVGTYSELIDEALEQRQYKVENKLSSSLRTLAISLGTCHATPKDAVEIHTAAVSKKLASKPVLMGSLINSESRYLLTGLLGHLCSFYQNHIQMLPVSEKAGTADEFGDSRSQYSGLSMDADG